MITIDTREPKALRLALSCALEEARIPYKHEALWCGDFDLRPKDGASILVERKEQKDLSSSIIDGRLSSQIDHLVSYQDGSATKVHLVLLVEGPPFPRTGTGWRAKDEPAKSRPSGIHPNSLRGALLSIQQRGIFVLYSKEAQDTIQALLWLYRRFQREETR